MLSYLLTFLTAIPWIVVLAMTPKYWGAIDAKHLTGSVLIFDLGWFLITWIIFRQLKENSSTSKNYINLTVFYCRIVLIYGVFLSIFCLIYGLISFCIHLLLSEIIDSEILDRFSLFVFGLGTVICLLRFRWIQPNS